MQLKTIFLNSVLILAPGLLHAQFDFRLAGRDVQVHSFASQGFAYSNDNNYLTMKTSSGSFAFTDAGANASTRLTDHFRVGAQFYTRNLGKLGNWQPTLDWAVADYRFKDWFGIRGGKVKTALGLFNDTQDMGFLHTWALVPQSTYPLDQRGSTIAHLGGDVYGNFGLKKLGGLSYTVYGGKRPNDPEGGYLYSLRTSIKKNLGSAGIPTIVPDSSRSIDSYTGPVYGADVRWNTPLPGLMAGASYFHQDPTTTGAYKATNIPFLITTVKDYTNAYYVEYALGNFRFNGEYRRELMLTASTDAKGVRVAPNLKDLRSGYVSACYRLTKRLEVGGYHSRFYYDWASRHGDPSNHVFDQAVTARVDLTRYLDVKVEGHFMDGNMPSATINRGFYVDVNPNGMVPSTRLLVIRLGYHL